MGENVRPKEVTYASYIVLAEVIAGLIVAGINFALYESWTSGIGLLMAVVGIFIYFQILKQDSQAWTIAVIFSIVAILLYAYGDNWPGAILSLIAVIYLNMPDVKVHFQQ
ncbi:MAG: hypothetical protein ACW98Y_17575 [Candidatus Thorarchaeota archaeon]|jgi:hypothetical protein